jgi:galactokinase
MESTAVRRRYERLYGPDPVMIRAPGRVNLIGEHTDYNEGFVLPAAVDLEIVLAVGRNRTGRIRIFAEDLNESFEQDLAELRISECRWANYLLGVVAQFKDAGVAVDGIDCVFGGNIPVGAGLSSSAAIEVGFAVGINHLSDAGFDKIALALMAQSAENQYAGVRCGIMDQFACIMGRKNQAMKLDCRSLEAEYYSVDMADWKIVLINTLVEHALAASQYNERRRECERGVELLRTYEPSLKSLRDVPPDLLVDHGPEFDPAVLKRCRYVLAENQRLQEACEHLREGDIRAFGEKMHDSHAGLRDDYEVSCPELDILEKFARDDEAVAGARMMGGGFGGCTINIVERHAVDEFTARVEQEYEKQTGISPEFYVTDIHEGSSIYDD